MVAKSQAVTTFPVAHALGVAKHYLSACLHQTPFHIDRIGPVAEPRSEEWRAEPHCADLYRAELQRDDGGRELKPKLKEPLPRESGGLVLMRISRKASSTPAAEVVKTEPVVVDQDLKVDAPPPSLAFF